MAAGTRGSPRDQAHAGHPLGSGQQVPVSSFISMGGKWKCLQQPRCSHHSAGPLEGCWVGGKLGELGSQPWLLQAPGLWVVPQGLGRVLGLGSFSEEKGCGETARA